MLSREFEAITDKLRGVRVTITPIVGDEGMVEGGACRTAGAGCDAGEEVEKNRKDVGFECAEPWISEWSSMVEGC